MAEIERQLLEDTATLYDVLLRLNQGVSGAVLIVDGEGRMVGMFTDGDARRAVLAGARMDSPAIDSMNRNFTSAQDTASSEERLRLLTDPVRHLPILDKQGRPVELVSWAQFWKLPLVEPSLGGNELKYVSECIKTNWISSQGEFVRRFEERFAEYHEVDHAISVSNGTAALHLALEGMGVGPGDEVIVPDLTFGATANAVIHAGATPVLVDVLEGDWTIDPEEVRRAITPKTKAIIPVHLYGLSAEMKSLQEIAEEHGLLILEDCAESLGALYEGELTGTFGEVAAFSFFANKTITTGEGGMILVREESLADRLRLLRDHGMNKERRYWHDIVGYNYRITNMQSAVGCAQMERLDAFLDHRQALGKAYRDRLSSVPGIVFQEIEQNRKSSFWLFSILVAEDSEISRDQLMRELNKEGIETRPLFYPLGQQPAFEKFVKYDCPVSHSVSSRGLSLPTSNHMDLGEVDRVCDAIEIIFKRGCLPAI